MRYLKLIILGLVIFTLGFKSKAQIQENRTIQYIDSIEVLIEKIWGESTFKETVSHDIFLTAMRGYYKFNSFKTGEISIIDYSMPSTAKRFYVIDLVNKTLLFNTLIAHGKNTGNNSTVRFSNIPKSLESSLGFFKTAETYIGKHGYSLKLDGLEKGINDNARKRSIVIHGATYVSSKFMKKNGRLGRSWGCPALPVLLTTEIINKISNGTCLFIYGNSEEYLTSSMFLK
ncbi:MAG: murein L,D-transpeptidase catalytic domain family protein [Labilibaculum antarcticum]